jgi:hypothetical protein
MNRKGHSATLVSSHPKNLSAVTHGAYSTGRVLAPRAAEIADAIMTGAHITPLDRAGAEEIGSLVALLERVDGALEDGRVEGKGGQPRALIDLRSRLSGRLEKWLSSYGLTPLSRASWAESLARGGLAAEIARRRAAANEDAHAQQ